MRLEIINNNNNNNIASHLGHWNTTPLDFGGGYNIK